MPKKELRKKYISHLRSLSSVEKQVIERKMYENLWGTSYWQEANMIGVTWSQSFEWNTLPIIERAWEEEKRVAIPKVNELDRKMKFYEIKDTSEVEEGFRSLMEPNTNLTTFVPKKAIDLLIVPGVVFTTAGNRIGFGGGFYDRYLTDFQQRTLSLCSEAQIVEYIEHEVHDQRVQILVTEERIIETKNMNI